LLSRFFRQPAGSQDLRDTASIIAIRLVAHRCKRRIDLSGLKADHFESGCVQSVRQVLRQCASYPLTITDFASRYLLCCDALAATTEMYAFTVFERVFKDFGLPLAIRTDNRVPFASNSAFFGLSQLRCGGYAWGSRSSASSLAIRNRTAGTSACT
jgi:hypothetical protein